VWVTVPSSLITLGFGHGVNLESYHWVPHMNLIFHGGGVHYRRCMLLLLLQTLILAALWLVKYDAYVTRKILLYTTKFS